VVSSVHIRNRLTRHILRDLSSHSSVDEDSSLSDSDNVSITGTN